MNGGDVNLEVDEVDDTSGTETGIGLGVAEKMVEARECGTNVMVRQ